MQISNVNLDEEIKQGNKDVKQTVYNWTEWYSVKQHFLEKSNANYITSFSAVSGKLQQRRPWIENVKKLTLILEVWDSLKYGDF